MKRYFVIDYKISLIFIYVNIFAISYLILHLFSLVLYNYFISVLYIIFIISCNVSH